MKISSASWFWIAIIGGIIGIAVILTWAMGKQPAPLNPSGNNQFSVA